MGPQHSLTKGPRCCSKTWLATVRGGSTSMTGLAVNELSQTSSIERRVGRDAMAQWRPMRFNNQKWSATSV